MVTGKFKLWEEYPDYIKSSKLLTVLVGQSSIYIIDGLTSDWQSPAKDLGRKNKMEVDPAPRFRQGRPVFALVAKMKCCWVRRTADMQVHKADKRRYYVNRDA